MGLLQIILYAHTGCLCVVEGNFLQIAMFNVFIAHVYMDLYLYLAISVA